MNKRLLMPDWVFCRNQIYKEEKVGWAGLMQ